jgi:CheY-like chemotaxis protein
MKKDINFDLLLLDETLPYINGSSLIRLLVSMRKDKFQSEMKIVSISGNNDESFIEYLKREGCYDVISKEIKKSDLEKLFNNLFLSKENDL